MMMMVSFGHAARRRALGLHSRAAVVNALRIVWVLVVLWCELGAFFWSVAWCRWPKQPGSTPFRVLLVADPQVPRPYRGWTPTLTWLKQHIVNHNLRKSWNAAGALRPHVVVFLGDMLRHGSKIKGMPEYGDYFAQFQSIFRLDPAVSTYFIPGNRDVGLGSSRTFSAHARDRFEAHFGPTNQIVTLGNHTLVLLDAPALVEEDYRRHGAQARFSDWLGIDGGSIDFVKSVATMPRDHPVVLFTHIPLARPDAASCGPLREHGNIRRGVGRGYQNLLGRDTSRFLLDSTSPAVIFSADDHDYCEYLHPAWGVNTHPVREITVKSFSMATKLKRPGFQLLSLFSPSDSDQYPSHADTTCLLPNQSKIYTHGYAPLFFGSILLLVFLNLRRHRTLQLNGSHQWDDPVALRAHEASSSDVSPIAPSPPASPIHFKSSHSHHPGLRSASTLTPNAFPSQPPTPLGGTPLLSPAFRPASADDEDGQELLIWPAHASSTTPKLSPYLQTDAPHDVDSSYFLPSPGARPVTAAKKSVWLPRFGPRARLATRRRGPCVWAAGLLVRPLHVAAHVLWSGGPLRRAHTWHGRVGQDAVRVWLLPAVVYCVISLWLSR